MFCSEVFAQIARSVKRLLLHCLQFTQDFALSDAQIPDKFVNGMRMVFGGANI